MAMLMNPRETFTSVFSHIVKNSSTGSSKGLKLQRLKLKRRTKRTSKETKKTLLYGKQQNKVNRAGNQNGVQVGLVGILNVLQWQPRFLAKNLIFTLEESI